MQSVAPRSAFNSDGKGNNLTRISFLFVLNYI